MNERTTYNYDNDFLKIPANDQYDDTLTGTGEYYNVGTASYLQGHPGILNLAASTNGNKTFMTSGSSFDDALTLGNNTTWRHEELSLIPSLSGATDRFVYTSGFNNTTDTIASIANGCFFKYSDNINSGKWQGVCTDGTAATCDTGTTVVVDTWYRLTIVVNSAGNSVDFRVNGSSACTVTTHIPAASTLLSFESIVNKTAGNALRGVFTDYLSVSAQFTNGR